MVTKNSKRLHQLYLYSLKHTITLGFENYKPVILFMLMAKLNSNIRTKKLAICP